MDILKNLDEKLPLANFGGLKMLMVRLEQVQSGVELTSFLKNEATTNGYAVLGMLDYNPTSSSKYTLSTFGDLSDELIASLDNESSYLHCRHGYRIKQMDQTLNGGVYLLPLRGVSGICGGLIFNVPENLDAYGSIDLIDWYWTLLSPYLLEAALRCRSDQINITKREKDCLKWASEGKTSWEISQILDISERTVNFHLSNCVTKTDSANRQQAIVKCIVKNLI
ncbi:helix-turn-helix transcriptional regulator [Pseudoalteromonas sp. J010]|uniref:helix-turn-helix transcriptional regulator n=1 Tax=Pseudoalteromonas sp. J010 TaxID=998465 RepID=UPI0023B9DC10|nr:helix-turn-helix transcriptional regulator [Pseudoalteromonas sp. J010]